MDMSHNAAGMPGAARSVDADVSIETNASSLSATRYYDEDDVRTSDWPGTLATIAANKVLARDWFQARLEHELDSPRGPAYMIDEYHGDQGTQCQKDEKAFADYQEANALETTCNDYKEPDMYDMVADPMDDADYDTFESLTDTHKPADVDIDTQTTGSDDQCPCATCLRLELRRAPLQMECITCMKPSYEGQCRCPTSRTTDTTGTSRPSVRQDVQEEENDAASSVAPAQRPLPSSTGILHAIQEWPLDEDSPHGPWLSPKVVEEYASMIRRVRASFEMDLCPADKWTLPTCRLPPDPKPEAIYDEASDLHDREESRPGQV